MTAKLRLLRKALRSEPIRAAASRFEPTITSLWVEIHNPLTSQKFLLPRGRHTYGPEPRLVGVAQFAVGSRIGSFCSIAPGVELLFLGRHAYEWVSTYPFYDFFSEWGVEVNHWRGGKAELGSIDPEPIVIGSDVWIAANVKIKQGVSIADGAVVATESFVTSDVPPYAIVGGNPARIIRYRFTEEQIADLLMIAWWNWEDDEIRKFAPLLVSDRVGEFIAKAKAARGID